ARARAMTRHGSRTREENTEGRTGHTISTPPTPLRKILEGTITEAREIAESGARKALQALAVHAADPYPHMNDAQRELRRKLQAQARQLGDRESLTRPGM